MTIPDLLCYLRLRLLNATEAKDRVAFRDIKIIFGQMVEASYTFPNRSLTGLLVDLEDVARDGCGDMALKVEIPSEEAIRSACNADS